MDILRKLIHRSLIGQRVNFILVTFPTKTLRFGFSPSSGVERDTHKNKLTFARVMFAKGDTSSNVLIEDITHGPRFSELRNAAGRARTTR